MPRKAAEPRTDLVLTLDSITFDYYHKPDMKQVSYDDIIEWNGQKYYVSDVQNMNRYTDGGVNGYPCRIKVRKL